MTISSVSTRLHSLTEAPAITAFDEQFFFAIGSEHVPLSARAMRNAASLTGLTAGRLHSLAKSGGAQLADLLRGTSHSSIAISVHNGRVVAIADRLPKQIDAAEVMTFIDHGQYRVSDPQTNDGRLRATTVSSEEVLIGGEVHQFGHVVDLDLAGYDRPQMHHFVERQVCLNGAVIRLAMGKRRIPQFDVEGEVNARALTDHVRAWSRQGNPDEVVRRLDVASRTTASFAEVLSLQRLTRTPELTGLRIASNVDPHRVETRADPAFSEMLGSYHSRLGVASLNEIPSRDLAFLPSETSVAGLVNLATEISTHIIRNREGERLVAWWNHLLGGRYDLEGLDQPGRTLPARWIPHHQAPLPN